jgi:hypothetical protein
VAWWLPDGLLHRSKKYILDRFANSVIFLGAVGFQPVSRKRSLRAARFTSTNSFQPSLNKLVILVMYEQYLDLEETIWSLLCYKLPPLLQNKCTSHSLRSTTRKMIFRDRAKLFLEVGTRSDRLRK